MSRDSHTPRHAAVCQRPAGRRLQHAVLPVALGGLVAGSVWLAADAAAAPAAHHPCRSDAPAQADATSPGGSSWGGSDAAWPDGGGRTPYADRNYRDSRYYDGYHDWRDHTGNRRYADHSRVVVQRPPAQPHHATSAKTGPAGAVAAAQARAAQPEQRSQEAAAAPPAAIRSAAHSASRPRSAGAPMPGATSTPRPEAVRRLSASARSNLASADTTPAATDYVALYGAIGGAALAALLGMGGVAVWRRRGTGAA